MLTFEQVEENVAELKRRVEATMAKCARTDEVKIVAATKTQPKELIDFIESKRLLTDVGENRVQEFLTKYTPASLLRWHLIGQLQSNKVKYIIDKAALIHSLDRYSLADEIQKQAVKHGLTAHCLIEVNMGSELSKGGIEPYRGRRHHVGDAKRRIAAADRLLSQILRNVRRAQTSRGRKHTCKILFLRHD